MTVVVRPAQSHPAVGLLSLLPRCLAQRHPCGTTKKAPRLFNCTSQRGQSSSAAPRIVSKALQPAQWQIPRDGTRRSVAKRTPTRQLATDTSPSTEGFDTAAVSTVSAVSGNANFRHCQSDLKSTSTRSSQSTATTEGRRQHLERVIQYTFEDDHYFQAATHKDLKLEDDVLPRTQLQLAIIGDCLIKMIWYAEQFPLQDPVRGNRRWGLVASNKALARIATNFNLRFLGTDADSEAPCGKTSEHALGTLVEAIVGAVYLDSGHSYTATKDVVERLTLLDPGIMRGKGARPTLQPQIQVVKPQVQVVKPQPTTHRERRHPVKGRRPHPLYRKALKRTKRSKLQTASVTTTDSSPSTSVVDLYAQFHA